MFEQAIDDDLLGELGSFDDWLGQFSNPCLDPIVSYQSIGVAIVGLISCRFVSIDLVHALCQGSGEQFVLWILERGHYSAACLNGAGSAMASVSMQASMKAWASGATIEFPAARSFPTLARTPVARGKMPG